MNERTLQLTAQGKQDALKLLVKFLKGYELDRKEGFLLTLLLLSVKDRPEVKPIWNRLSAQHHYMTK